jgi:hypothetical protein
MNTYDPVSLRFGGIEQFGPGGNAETLHVLRPLPRHQFRMVADAGCGTGRQTLAHAIKLGALVHAVYSYKPFLKDLVRRAIEAKRIRRLGKEKAAGWPSPQYEGSALFSPEGKTSLRNTLIKPFQSKAAAGSTSPVALWV